MRKYTNRIEPFAAGFLESDAAYIGKKIACGMFEASKHRKIKIDPATFFVGGESRNIDDIIDYTFGDGIRVSADAVKAKIAANPEYADELSDILEKMLPLDTGSLYNSRLNDNDKNYNKSAIGWGGGWAGHANPDFGLLLKIGTIGLKKKISEMRAQNPGNDEFYDAATISVEAFEVLCERYRKLASEMAKTALGEEKAHLLRIADAFSNIPQNPPRDFFEACQYFWIQFTFDGRDSPGRFDRYMIEFYRKSEEHDRKECLEKLWQLFYDYRVWNLCVSGSDENWNDETNELSVAILETARKYKYNTPNLTVRVHRNTPEYLWQEIAQTIATGIGMPAIYNDETVCPALEALGIPPCDSHEYCMNGCNQIDIFGKSHMGLEDGEVNLAKCVALTLSDGVCAISGKQIGIKTGDPRRFDSFEDFLLAYKKMVEHFADWVTDLSNRSQKLYAEYAPNPYRSNLIVGCLESARDMKNHGPLYNHGQVLMEGVADAVDSLAAIKHFVYDEKKYTMDELVSALEKDFEGYEDLHRDFSGYGKFGNEDEECDTIFKDITEHFSNYLLTLKTWRGGVYGAGCSPFNRAANYGKGTGPLPNGKKLSSSLFADSFGAVPGCDKKGATALLNSVLKYDHKLAKSGLVLQLKFDKNVFETQNGMASFIALAKTYMARGGQQLSVNVVSAQDLLEARKYPEKYKSLVVRVGGYSAHFNDLSPELQENIIARTLL